MIEAVRHLGEIVGHRAAGDQPHHQLDALRAGFAHVLDVRHLREARRIGDETVEEGIVPFAVDEAGARPLQLVAHAAGAPDLDLEGRVVGFDRLADGAPQIEAAPARRHRVLHDVHREGNHRARPRRGLPAHQRQRHGEAVVDVHPVHDGEVEVVHDHRLGDVGGQLRMALHRRHRARAPAFVGGPEFRRAADGEGRDDLQAEGRGVVVVDQEDDVGRVVLHPLLRKLEAGEHFLPVRLAGPALVDGHADGRHV